MYEHMIFIFYEKMAEQILAGSGKGVVVLEMSP